MYKAQRNPDTEKAIGNLFNQIAVLILESGIDFYDLEPLLQATKNMKADVDARAQFFAEYRHSRQARVIRRKLIGAGQRIVVLQSLIRHLEEYPPEESYNVGK